MAAVSAAAAVAVPVTAFPEAVAGEIMTVELRTVGGIPAEMRKWVTGLLIGEGDDMMMRNDDPAEASIRVAVTAGIADPARVPTPFRPLGPAVGTFTAWSSQAAETDAGTDPESIGIFPRRNDPSHNLLHAIGALVVSSITAEPHLQDFELKIVVSDRRSRRLRRAEYFS